jgi:16S rRNA (guanine527-N7)-methyltransferase
MGTQMNDFGNFISDLHKLSLVLEKSQLDCFQRYFELLVAENKRVNLTAITGREEVFKKHFVDSLSICEYISLAGDSLAVLDVGSGAGFPGLPLKIAFPQLQVALLEAQAKRVRFLEAVIEQLGLANIAVLHGRAEEFAHLPAHREQYDLCVSRGVASLAVLAEYCLPFVKTGGLFVAYKAADTDELAAAAHSIATLGGEPDRQLAFTLPGSELARSLIGIRKISPTPDKYPRRVGVARKRPL